MRANANPWLVVALAAQLSAAAATACPACSWSKPVKQKPGVVAMDPASVSKGFNVSVGFMLATVYGVPGLLGLALWRTIRAHQSRRRGVRRAPVSDSTVLEMNAIPVREEAGS